MAETVLTTPEVQKRWVEHMWTLALKYNDPHLAAELVTHWPEWAPKDAVVQLLDPAD